MIWRLLAHLVLPRSWTRRAWPEPPITMEFFDLQIRTVLVPALREDLFRPNPLFERLR